MNHKSKPWYATLLATKKKNVLTVGDWACELAANEVVETFFATARPRVRTGQAATASFGGFLKHEQAALGQLEEIERALRAMPVREIPWNPIYPIEDYRGSVNRQAANAFEFFLDANGGPLLSAFQKGVQRSVDTGQALRMTCPGPVEQYRKAGLVTFLAGIFWTALFLWLVPSFSLGRRGAIFERGGFPIWLLGPMLSGMGAGMIVLAVAGTFQPSVFRRQAVIALCFLAGMFLGIGIPIALAIYLS